ncbi:hypothetical protein FBUS_07634 [Fasciolopsis buskii]|uniref:Uncharacterized protein n=1 Tax=Fasciolopsis buskii TaxID=27845 RepID=A0A8E0VKS2_9TREM|nr:hypothetical protein FBUS_07634 [Fasciolopsis buski]
MVRAFLETLFTCSKSVPNRTDTGTDSNEENNIDHSHVKSYEVIESRTRSQNHSSISSPVIDLGSFRSVLNFNLKKSKHSRYTNSACSLEPELVSDLIQEMQQARLRLMDCQALDKWIEKWQENEFRRYENHKLRAPRRHSVSCSQLMSEKLRRPYRKLAQGRAQSEHALLSAKHIKRRDELIRKVWEAVGPPSNQIRRQNPRNETWETYNTDVLEVNNSLCKSELTVSTLNSPLRAKQTKMEETVSWNKHQPCTMELHVSQQLGVRRTQSDLLIDSVEENDWIGMQNLPKAEVTIEKLPICDRIATSQQISQANCVRTPTSNAQMRVTGEREPGDQKLHDLSLTTANTDSNPIPKYLTEQTYSTAMPNPRNSSIQRRPTAHQSGECQSTNRSFEAYWGQTATTVSRFSPTRSKIIRLQKRHTLTRLQRLKTMQLFGERKRPASVNLTDASVNNSMNNNSKQGVESNPSSSSTETMSNRPPSGFTTSMSEATPKKINTTAPPTDHTLGNKKWNSNISRKTQNDRNRSPSIKREKQFSETECPFLFQYYQPVESVESTISYTDDDDDTIIENNNNNTNNNYIVSTNENKDLSSGLPFQHPYPSNIQLIRQNNRRTFRMPSLLTKRRPVPRFGSWFASREIQSHNQGPSLPLLRLEDLKSYTLTSSTPTHVCDGKAKPEDQTSDTFILSAASEFLHSTSEEQFAFKHRPRPGIAPGKKRKPSTSPAQEDQHTSVALEPLVENRSEDQKSSVVSHKTYTLVPVNNEEEQTKNVSPNKDDEDNSGNRSTHTNGTEAPASEEEFGVEQTPPKVENQTRVESNNEPDEEIESHQAIKTEHVTQTVDRKPPVRFVTSPRKRLWRLKNRIREKIARKRRRKRPTKTGKPPWNISTRNLAKQFHDVRPIESILWPEGRMPAWYTLTEWIEPDSRRIRERFRSKEKRESRKPRRRRHQTTSAGRQQSNITLTERDLGHWSKQGKANWNWKFYRNLVKYGLTRKRKKSTTKASLRLGSRLKRKNSTSRRSCSPSRSPNARVDMIKCGDDFTGQTKRESSRRHYHLQKNEEKGDQMNPNTRPFACQLRNMASRSRSNRTRKYAARNPQPMEDKWNTTRHFVGRPRLWSAVSRERKSRPISKRSSSRKKNCLVPRSRSPAANACNHITARKSTNRWQSMKDRVKANFKRRIRGRPKSSSQGRESRTCRQYSYNNTDDEISQDDDEMEPEEKVDFFAYLAIIPSEIDELVLPFRACNRLRACLKNIENLLSTLESEVADMDSNNDINASSTGNKRSRSRKFKVRDDLSDTDENGPRKADEEETKAPQKSGVKFLEKVPRQIDSPQHPNSPLSTRIDSPLHDSLIVNNSAQTDPGYREPSVISASTVHSDTIRMPYLDPDRIKFWNGVLHNCEDRRLDQLIKELRSIKDRRIFAIEQRTQTRIRLDETVVFSVHGLPCMELRIVAYRVRDLQRALVQLEINFPRLFRQILFTERFYGDAAPGTVYRFPTTNEFFFQSTESTACGQPSVSTVRRVIPVIEKARAPRRSRGFSR